MGISLFRISTGTSYLTTPGNPDPNRFVIERCKEIVGATSTYTVALIKYPGCTNFEGNKVIVWKDVTAAQVRRMTSIDPHFTPDANIIARFVPTNDGWNMAIRFTSSLDGCLSPPFD